VKRKKELQFYNDIMFPLILFEVFFSNQNMSLSKTSKINGERL